MTSTTAPATPARRALFARLLAFVLLALVSYAATVEAVHKHGYISPDSPAAQTTSVGQPGQGESSLKDSYAFGDCLICQLHGQLSGGLLSPLPQVIAPVEVETRSQAVRTLFFSHTHATRRGRAPPVTSLI